MNIELIAQPLLIAERPAGEDPGSGESGGDGQMQAAILLVTVADRDRAF
jgi:hypothetical protein